MQAGVLMKKDYSEYVPTDYEKYNALRHNHSDVKINLFYNHATVIPNEKRIRLEVNGDFEELTIKDELDEFSGFEKAKFNVRDEIHSPEEEQEYEEHRLDDIRKNNELF